RRGAAVLTLGTRWDRYQGGVRALCRLDAAFGMAFAQVLLAARSSLVILVRARAARRTLPIASRRAWCGPPEPWYAGDLSRDAGLVVDANDAAAAIACGACLVELKAIRHARIEEDLDGGKGNDQPLGDAVECQLHLEANVADDELPEAMLEHD